MELRESSADVAVMFWSRLGHMGRGMIPRLLRRRGRLMRTRKQSNTPRLTCKTDGHGRLDEVGRGRGVRLVVEWR